MQVAIALALHPSALLKKNISGRYLGVFFPGVKQTGRGRTTLRGAAA